MGQKKDGMLLRDALTDPNTGMFSRDDVHLVLEENSTEIIGEIDTFFGAGEPDDTLLFYYSGHGKTLNQQLFLCGRDTNVSRLYSTAISKATLDGIVSMSFAQVKIMVVDCCNSGLIKGSDFAEILSGKGRYVLTATSPSERAADGRMRGMPSPFTYHLSEALISEAVDRDGDGNVDLDDVYHYLESVKFDGSRPERSFDGSGAITIARRSLVLPASNETSSQLPSNATPLLGGAPTGQPYLETEVPGASFSPEKVAEFRDLMRDDILERIPRQLSSKEFLRRVGVLKGEVLTYAGVLLFGDNPTEFLPTAMVQCVRFMGAAKTDPLEIIDLQGTVPENIVRARDFVASYSRLGETATAEDAYAETTYKFPMIAVREIIANAIVHRNYEEQESCVQIHAYSDHIEIISPGRWAGSPIVDEGEILIGQLERQSWRPNFRLARILTWSKLVEGVGRESREPWRTAVP